MFKWFGTYQSWIGILVILFIGVTVISCLDEPCDTVACQNNGICSGEAECDCPDGFSGIFCEVEDFCITKPPVCFNNAGCVNGECDCLDGFQGDSCQVESRTLFIGNYLVERLCVDTADDSSSSAGSLAITASDSIQHISLTALHPTINNEVIGTLNAENQFEIFPQDPDNNAVIVSGDGTLEGDSILIEYVVEDTLDSTIVECTLIAK